jgi:hypothetical protein
MARNFGEIQLDGYKLCASTLCLRANHFLRDNSGIYEHFDACLKEEGSKQGILQIRILIGED